MSKLKFLSLLLSFFGCGSLSRAALAGNTLSATEIADLKTTLINESTPKNPDKGIDFSTLSGSEFQGGDLCSNKYVPDATTQSGHEIKMLGTALVYAAPGNGQAVLGHVGERFIFCRDSQYFDVIYDYAPFDQATWNDSFDQVYGVPHAGFTGAEKRNLFDSLFEEANFSPAELYAGEQANDDRTIYEAWFKLDGASMYKMMILNVDRYNEQISKLKAHQPLPPYKIPSDDCVTPLTDDLDLVNPNYLAAWSPARLTPGFFYAYVKDHDVDHIIMYPSQRQFRLLVLRAEGKSTAFQWFLPTSTVSGDYPDSWALIFPGTHYGLLRYFVISPIAGTVNFMTAIAETIFGAVTSPLTLLGQIPGLHALASDDWGAHRFERGLNDIFDSVLETFSFQVRFPQPTDWTPEERQFFQNFAQDSVLLSYLGAKYDDAPLVINMSDPSAKQPAPQPSLAAH